MPLPPRIERDRLQRVIQVGDIAVWTNKKYGKGIDLVRVVGFNKRSLSVINLATKVKTRVEDMNNLLVITAQITANMAENVGANLDLERYREEQ